MKSHVVVFMAVVAATALSAEEWTLKVHFTPAQNQIKITLAILKNDPSNQKALPVEGSVQVVGPDGKIVGKSITKDTDSKMVEFPVTKAGDFTLITNSSADGKPMDMYLTMGSKFDLSAQGKGTMQGPATYIHLKPKKVEAPWIWSNTKEKNPTIPVYKSELLTVVFPPWGLFSTDN
jgi:hypothetical protein